MSFQAVTWAIKQKAGSPSAKAVLWSIANYANENGVAWPSQALIGEESEQSSDSVQRRLSELVRLHLVRRIPLRFSGRKTVDFFVLAISPWFAVNLDKIEPFLPRGCVIDPHFARNEQAQDGDCSRSDATAYCGNAGATLPQTLPQSAADVTAYVRQQEPVMEPIEPIERENARARELQKKLGEFRQRWPTAALDDQAKTEKAWLLLPDGERQAAIDGIPTFLEDLKRHRRGHVPAGWKYLEERRWKLLAKADEPAKSGNSVFGCWSREWWGLLVARCKRSDRQMARFMVDHAVARGERETQAPSAEMPSAEEVAAFRNYPSDGPEMADWRPWFEQRGIRLPEWRERIWVFLPAPSPNPEAQKAGPPKGELMTEDDIREFAENG